MTSLWLEGATPVADDPVPDRTPDVLVIGAGLTGLTTALLLARAGQDVACVEARSVGAVTTGNTTGKVSLLQGTHLSRILRHQTSDVAQSYVEANQEGMAWLLRFCAEHDVPVQRRHAVTYAATEAERARVQEEHRAAASLGLEVHWQERLDVPFPHVGATVLDDQAQLDAMDVLGALVAELRRHGGTLTQGTRVRSVSRSGEPVVGLEDGRELRARHVVVATGASILDRGLHFAKVEPQRSYALAYQWTGGLEGMYLSAGSDSRSVRDAPGGHLVVGGSGHTVGRTRSEQAHVDELRAWTAQHFPDAAETHRWSAQDYSSYDGVPFVGRLPGGEGRIHVATGYEKWGMTNAVAAARTISADLLGDVPPWAAVLAGRLPRAAGAAEAARMNAGVGVAAATRVAKAALERVPGTSASPTAYDCGVVGVCTHLGGLLKWNDAEGSWDCPLHGSRFAADGEVLEGPATRPLRRRGR